MHFPRLLAATLFCAIAFSGAASAKGFLYDCDMSDAGASRGWISSKVAVVVPEDGKIKIVDGLILYFNEKPLDAVVLRNNDRRLIVKWSLENAKADNGRSFANFDYRASISKTTGKIELTAMPRSFGGGLRSSGTCRKRSQ